MGTLGDSAGAGHQDGRKLVSEVVVERIVDMIADGDLAPGMTIPPERELARRFGVSLIALREATRVLKVLGVIRAVPGRGSVVLPEAHYAEFKRLGILFSLSAQGSAEVVEARSIIEGRSARLAAERAAPAEIDGLRAIVEVQRRLTSDVLRYPHQDEVFHRAVVVAAHNPILTTMLDAIRRPLRVVRQQTALLPGRLEKATRYHADLVEAIARRDPDGAERVLLEHLEDVRADVNARLGS